MKKIKYSQTDYSPSFLPQTRKEILKDVYKVRFSLIIKCGLTLLLFALPLIAVLISLDLPRFGLNGYSEEQLESFYFYWNIFARVGIIPSLYILLVGVSGISRVIKLLIWQEGIDYWYDFKLGVKENYKTMSIASIFITIIYLLYWTIFFFFVISPISYIALVIICILFVPMYFWYLMLANTYNAKTKELMTNSLFFFGKTVGWSLLWTALLIWPLLFEYFQIPFTLLTAISKPIVLSLLLVFYYPFLLIVMELYSNHHFDEWINSKAYPDFYRKGLFNSETFNDEEDEY